VIQRMWSAMVSTQPSLPELIQKLPPDLVEDVRLDIEFLIEHRNRQTTAARGWPEGYFEAIAGSIPSFPDIHRSGDGIDEVLDDVVSFENSYQ
jgi:hypothetical protein